MQQRTLASMLRMPSPYAHLARCLSTSPSSLPTPTEPNDTAASMLIYQEYGDPLQVLRKEPAAIPKPRDDEVLVRILAAPVNPADINTIQGKYPARAPPPAVPGIEGIGQVLETGAGVEKFIKGDHVIPLEYGLGTWRTHLVFHKDQILKVPKKLDVVQGATLAINPCTAYRMLKDFTTLYPGEVVIQNGANSAVGQNVIQICKTWGLLTVNVVRNRPGIPDLKNYLSNLGATHVLIEEELRTTDLFKTGKLKKPKLALNCVGGKSGLELLRHLQPDSTMVTYGGMSMEKVKVPTAALIFKNIRVRGFWVTEWSKKNAKTTERRKMFREIVHMMINGELRAPAHKLISYTQYEEALANTLSPKGMTGLKYILDFRKN